MRAVLMFHPMLGAKSQDSVHKPQLSERKGERTRTRTNVCLQRLAAGRPKRLTARVKLQALVHNILPPTTAIIHYATGLEKLSANAGQFFVGAHVAVIL